MPQSKSKSSDGDTIFDKVQEARVLEDAIIPNWRMSQDIHGIKLGAAVSQVVSRRNIFTDFLNFDPHDADLATGETYYQLWRRQYQTNPYARAHPNIVCNLVMGSGFDLKSTDTDEIKKWDDWKRYVNFLPIIRQCLRTALVFGNGYTNIPDADEYFVDSSAKIALQPLQPDYVWNITDDTGKILSFWYSPYSAAPPPYKITEDGEVIFDKRYTKQVNAGTMIPENEVFYIRFDQLGADVYGRPLGASLENDLDQIELLEAIQYIMGYREAHGMIIFEVDTTGLPDVPEAAGGTSKLDQKMNSFATALRNQERFDTRTRNMRIASRIVIPTRMVPDGTGKLTQVGGITPKPVIDGTDMEGMNETIKLRQKKIAMGYQVPMSFSGLSEMPGRGQSTGELTTFAQFLKSIWQMIAAEIETKIFPALGIKSHLRYNEIISGKEALAAQNAKIIDAITVLTVNERRAIIADIMDADIPIEPEEELPLVPQPGSGFVPPGGGETNQPKTDETVKPGVPRDSKDPEEVKERGFFDRLLRRGE